MPHFAGSARRASLVGEVAEEVDELGGHGREPTTRADGGRTCTLAPVLISDQHRMLFVHVQKTGGVSIDRMLRGHIDDFRSVASRHATLTRILKNEPELHAYWTFGFVRNPWTRMVSWWSMIEKWNKFNGPRSGKEHGDRRLNPFWVAADSYGDFEEFIMRGPEELQAAAHPADRLPHDAAPAGRLHRPHRVVQRRHPTRCWRASTCR